MSTFYTACIRSVITYAAPAFFYALPKYLKDELVQVEKRAMSIIRPGLPYQETIELVNIVPIGTSGDKTTIVYTSFNWNIFTTGWSAAVIPIHKFVSKMV